MKNDPLYNQYPMPRREIYVNLVKAAALYSSAYGLFFFGTESYLGYLDEHFMIVIILAMGCAIWGGTYFVRIGSGMLDRRHHN